MRRSSTLNTSTLLSIRFASPESTLPGPTSTTRVTPCRTSSSTHSIQRTGAVTCSTSSGTIRAASAFGVASTFVTTGSAAPPRRSAAARGSSRAFTGSISAQWKGADTGSGSTRFAPASLSRAPARSTAPAAPAITVCAGSL